MRRIYEDEEEDEKFDVGCWALTVGSSVRRFFAMICQSHTYLLILGAMKRSFAFVLLLLFCAFSDARAQSLDDQYVQIFGLIQEGDSLAGTDPTQALAKYTQAQTSLQKLQKENPSWNSSVVSFRLGYLADHIKSLGGKVPTPVVSTSAGTNAAVRSAAPSPMVQPAAPAPPADWADQMNGLKEQIRQLNQDKALLEAKLKEAFAAQPTQADPKELARAEEKVKSLQKENDLMKVTLDQAKAKPASNVDPKALEQSQQALAEANRQLAAQKEAASQWALEKQALQDRLERASAKASKAADLASENQSLKKQLADGSTMPASVSKNDDTALQLATAKQELAVQKDAADKLSMENQSLKRQLADAKSTPTSNQKTDNTSRQLSNAQTQIASLQSDKDTLRLEKAALEERVKRISSNTVTSSVLPPASSPDDLAQIRDLERQRDALQKKLDAADKALYGRKGKVVAGRVEELEGQLATMRARLEILEARQVPYSAEELALLRTPSAKLADPPPNTGKKSVKALPPGSGPLVAEAQNYFAAKQYAKAEAIYTQLLGQDPRNVAVLANLAAIQIEARHFDTAESNLRQALNVDPDDPYSLYMLGYLRYRQAHYDAALDPLSRAAKLDPQNPEVQNYLGLTLFEKGMRGPAETALRKSVELNPNFGPAHINLAGFYITQDPPYGALARFHYQKALDSGQPHNPTLEKMLEDAK